MDGSVEVLTGDFTREELMNMRRHAKGLLAMIERKLPLTPVCKRCYDAHKVLDKCLCK